jgi:hypothetical protein
MRQFKQRGGRWRRQPFRLLLDALNVLNYGRQRSLEQLFGVLLPER